MAMINLSKSVLYHYGSCLLVLQLLFSYALYTKLNNFTNYTTKLSDIRLPIATLQGIKTE